MLGQASEKGGIWVCLNGALAWVALALGNQGEIRTVSGPIPILNAEFLRHTHVAVSPKKGGGPATGVFLFEGTPQKPVGCPLGVPFF